MTKSFLRFSISTAIKVVAVAIFCLAGFAHSATITGKVVGVSDGDTITVLDASKTQHKIRLEGIDAPEKAQPFGQRSKQHLSDLVFGKQVEVVTNKTDKYGRSVGKVLVGGKDANLQQVRSGLAWHYKQYQSEQSASDREEYANAETSAQAQKSGLWVDPKPMPPREWRRGGKNEPTAASAPSGCLCGGANLCTGPRGGQYCVASNGKKKY